MPILKDLRKNIELTLPVTKGKVWIYDYILAGDQIEIDKIYVSETNVSVEAGQEGTRPISLRASKYYEAMDAQLTAMIAKWDFTDEAEKPIDPTPENIKKLPKQDFEYLWGKIEERISFKSLTVSEKKN